MGYCTVAEVTTLGIAGAAEGKESSVVQAEVDGQGEFIDGYLRKAGFVLPLLDWGSVLRKCNAALAAVALVDVTGRDPDADAVVDTIYNRWLKWLESVAAGKIIPEVTDSSPGATPGAVPAGAACVSSSSRGYSVRGTGATREPFQRD